MDVGKLVTLTKAAKAMAIRRELAYKWARSGVLPCKKLGGRWFTTVENLAILTKTEGKAA